MENSKKSIRARFKMLIAITLVAILLIGLVAGAVMFVLQGTVSGFSGEWMPGSLYALRIHDNVASLHLLVMEHMCDTYAGPASADMSEFQTIQSEIQGYLEDLKPIAMKESSGVSSHFQTLEADCHQLLSVGQQMLNATSIAEMEKYDDVFDEAFEGCIENVDPIVNQYSRAGQTAAGSVGLTLIIAIVAMIAVIVIAIVITYIYIKKCETAVLEPVSEITNVARSIADGDLNQRINYSSDDELGVLASDFNRTVVALSEYTDYINEIHRILSLLAKGNLKITPQLSFDGDFSKVKDDINDLLEFLNKAVANISRVADNVADSSDHVSIGAQSLSQGSVEQASSIEELSSAVTEISDQITDAATHAEQASEATSIAVNEMESSKTLMSEMIEAMNEISETSAEIDKIIKTIEDIAFQTNILALNAAVEAARAGSAGKGFAVVADEVRNLANKSAEAAQNTTLLIQAAMNAVENGTSKADQTSHSLDAVVEHATSSSKLVEKISVQAKDQAESIKQISEGINQISSVTTTSAATAEQSAAASEELASQAQMLKNLVSTFDFNETYLSEADSVYGVGRGKQFNRSDYGRTAYSSPDNYEAYTRSDDMYAIPSPAVSEPAPVSEPVKAPAKVSTDTGGSYRMSDNAVTSAVDDEFTPDDVDNKY